jgi:hypothetical protein
VQLEGLDKLKQFIGNRTRDLPVCSILLQPTALPRKNGNENYINIKRKLQNCNENTA